MIITGNVETQHIDKQEIDNRVIIRKGKGVLIQSFTKSLATEQRTPTTATEIAQKIRSAIRIEYKSKNIFKELELISLITEVSKALIARKEVE